MGADLDVVSTRTFTATALGYAFLIDGKLFTSSSFDSNVVDRVLDFATGAAASVDFRIDNLGAAYLSNTFYDPIQDRLYLQNSADSTLFSIDSASVAFRARAVPEPASVAMLGSGLLAVLAVARRRGARAPADRA